MNKILVSIGIISTLALPASALAATPKSFVIRYDAQTRLVSRYEGGTILTDIKRVQSFYRINPVYCATLPTNVGEKDPLAEDKRRCRNFVERVNSNYGEVGNFVDQWYCAKGLADNRCTATPDAYLQTANVVR